MAQQPRDALADRKPQPKPLLAPRRSLVQALELLEDALPVFAGDARSGVPDLDPQHAAAAARGQQNAAGLRVAQRVGQQVLQHPPQQPAVAAYVQGPPADPQGQAPCGGKRGELRTQGVEHLLDRE